MTEPVYDWDETICAHPGAVDIFISRRWRRDAVVRLDRREARALRDMLDSVLGGGDE